MRSCADGRRNAQCLQRKYTRGTRGWSFSSSGNRRLARGLFQFYKSRPCGGPRLPRVRHLDGLHFRYGLSHREEVGLVRPLVRSPFLAGTVYVNVVIGYYESFFPYVLGIAIPVLMLLLPFRKFFPRRAGTQSTRSRGRPVAPVPFTPAKPGRALAIFPRS